MAKIKYRDWSPNLATQERLLTIDRILAQYQGRVTVRQLYYRLVAGGHIPNVAKEYDKVQDLLTKARYAGLIDWEAIEDRGRAASRPTEWTSGRAALDATINSFRMDRWHDQEFYIELWVEKAALAGVLAPISDDYHLTMLAVRGYGSASVLKESANRIISRCRPSPTAPHGHRPVVLYLGDHDPSGEDMPRDIGARLLEFGVPSWLAVNKLALTMDQIEKYQPPPQPAKMSDARAQAYVEKHGTDLSWEVDALPPAALDLLIRTTVNAYIDKDKMKAAITRENIIKNRIKAFAASFQDVP